jgi:transposase
MPRTTTNAITLDEQEVSQANPVGAKKHSSHISSAKIVRIERRYLEGQSSREIARAENCGRNTVSKIVKAPELQEHLQRIRERIWGMADSAADVVLEAIVEKRDVRISYELLRDIGVLPRASQIVQQPAQLAVTREERDDWQTRAIASVIAERRRVFGIELPNEMQQALDQGEAAETKLPSLISTHPVSSEICVEGPTLKPSRF